MRKSTMAAGPVVAAGVLLGAVLGLQGNAVAPDSATRASAPNSSRPANYSGPDALRYALRHLEARREATDSEWLEHHLAEMLPNQKFTINGSAPRRLSAGVVVGTITSVGPGAGYAIAGSDADNGTVIAYESQDALWRVAELTVAVSSNFGAQAPANEVRVGLAFSGTADRGAIEVGLTGRRVLLALDTPGFFRHNEELYSIAHSGALLGLVDDGVFSLPVMGDDAAEFLNGVDTLAELRHEAAKKKNVLPAGT